MIVMLHKYITRQRKIENGVHDHIERDREKENSGEEEEEKAYAMVNK